MEYHLNISCALLYSGEFFPIYCRISYLLALE